MRRRRRSTDEDSHPDRWIVSYADFITLLFAFFIVMYAISTLNENKYRAVGNALGFAFNRPHSALPPPTMLGTTLPQPILPKPQPRTDDAARYAREQQLSGVAARMTDALAPLVESGQVRLKKSPAGLVVEIDASVLFAPAQATLRPGSIAALTAAARVVAEVANAVQVEGHTDSQPIASTVYPSNWELASARAASVVRLFSANGVDPKSAEIGYFSVEPVYDWKQPKRKLVGYRVNASTTLKLKDFNKIGPIVQALADTDVTDNQSLSYTLENIDAAKLKAVEDAYCRANDSAATVAKVGGRTLGELSYASVDTFEQVRVIANMARGPMPMMAGGLRVQSDAAPTAEFSPQTIQVTAHVNALFVLK